ncbi:hypothetical protein CCAND95_300057 [Capnocytophaga canis]|nr:hypothetical protein CCAND95_300057 [Capnocytophaga canis]
MQKYELFWHIQHLYLGKKQYKNDYDTDYIFYFCIHIRFYYDS